MTDIGRKLAALEKAVAELQRSARLSSASLDNTSLQVRDDSGSLRALVGQQGDGTTAVNIVNGPPPPQPSAPIAASVLGGVTVSWDGTFTDGAMLPLDWARTEVHASPLATYTPTAATLKATVETAQGGTIVIATPDPVYVQLVARSTSGTASTPSATVGPVGPTPVVATDILDGIVTTVKLADDAVTAAKVAVGAIGTTKITDEAITTPKIAAAAVQATQIDAEAVNAAKIAAGAVTTTKLDALAVTADKIAANSVIAGKIAAGAVSAQSLTVGLSQSIVTKLTDTMADSSTWARVGETGTFTTVTGVTDGVAGSTVLQVSGPASMERAENIPYDASALYRVTVRLRTITAPTTGNPVMYVGLTGIAADGVTRVNANGANSVNTNYYVAASALTVGVGTGWTTVTGYIQGTAATGTTTAAPDPRAPGTAHANVRYVRPLMRVLFGATGGVMQVDQVTVETVPTGAVNSVNIVDGAITADAVGASAITTTKLAAGSVDATALKADAITGKTITGGTINGADIHSNDGAGGTVDIANGAILVTGANSWKFAIEPNGGLPAIGFLDSTGEEAGLIFGSGNDAIPNMGLISGIFNDPIVGASRWLTTMGATASGNRVWTRRVGGTNLTQVSGGEAMIDDDASRISFIDTTDATRNTYLTLYARLAELYNARLTIAPPASADPALHLNAPTAQTGHLLRLQLNGVDRFTVTTTGAVSAAAGISAASLTASGGLIGSDLTVAGTSQARGYAAFQARSSATAGSTTEQIALTQANVVIKNGRAYQLRVSGLANNNTGNTGVRIRIRRTNISGAIWLDTYTVTTVNAGANYQYNNANVIVNDTGADITTTLVMTWVSVAGGISLLNAGLGLYTTMEVLDIGAAADFSTAQSAT